jgi:peptide/nickel transport system substrate-binding protein
VQGFHPSGPQAIGTLAGLPELEIYSAPSAGYGIVYLNLDRDTVPFFQEKEVRQALLYGLDRQALIDRVLSGQGLVANSPITPIVWAHDPTVRQYGYDPERAIGLLDAAGWLDSDADRIRDRDGTDLAFTLLTSDDMDMVQLAEELARQWREVGVEVTVRAVGPEAATDFVRTRNYDAALTEVVLTADPDPYPLWHSTQAGEPGQNFSGFANQDADAVMEEARSTVDEEERGQLLSTFQRIFAEEVPSLLLYYPIYTYAVDAQVREVQLSPLLHGSQRFRNISDWYIQTEEVAVTENGELDKTGE